MSCHRTSKELLEKNQNLFFKKRLITDAHCQGAAGAVCSQGGGKLSVIVWPAKELDQASRADQSSQTSLSNSWVFCWLCGDKADRRSGWEVSLQVRVGTHGLDGGAASWCSSMTATQGWDEVDSGTCNVGADSRKKILPEPLSHLSVRSLVYIYLLEVGLDHPESVFQPSRFHDFIIHISIRKLKVWKETYLHNVSFSVCGKVS